MFLLIDTYHGQEIPVNEKMLIQSLTFTDEAAERARGQPPEIAALCLKVLKTAKINLLPMYKLLLRLLL